jgi:hypothetical protein
MAVKTQDARSVSLSEAEAIWAAIRRIEDEGSRRDIAPRAPIVPLAPYKDPTENVTDQLAAAVKRIDDMAALEREHQNSVRKIDELHRLELSEVKRELRESEKQSGLFAREAESGRVNAKLADIVTTATLNNQQLANTAQALAATVATTAEAQRKTVEAAAAQQTELVGQLRDTVTTLAQTVAAIQAGGVGASAQRQETREVTSSSTRTNQWLIGLLVGAAVALAGIFGVQLVNRPAATPTPTVIVVGASATPSAR